MVLAVMFLLQTNQYIPINRVSCNAPAIPYAVFPLIYQRAGCRPSARTPGVRNEPNPIFGQSAAPRRSCFQQTSPRNPLNPNKNPQRLCGSASKNPFPKPSDPTLNFNCKVLYTR